MSKFYCAVVSLYLMVSGGTALAANEMAMERMDKGAMKKDATEMKSMESMDGGSMEQGSMNKMEGQAMAKKKGSAMMGESDKEGEMKHGGAMEPGSGMAMEHK